MGMFLSLSLEPAARIGADEGRKRGSKDHPVSLGEEARERSPCDEGEGGFRGEEKMGRMERVCAESAVPVASSWSTTGSDSYAFMECHGALEQGPLDACMGPGRITVDGIGCGQHHGGPEGGRTTALDRMIWPCLTDRPRCGGTASHWIRWALRSSLDLSHTLDACGETSAGRDNGQPVDSRLDQMPAAPFSPPDLHTKTASSLASREQPQTGNWPSGLGLSWGGCRDSRAVVWRIHMPRYLGMLDCICQLTSCFPAVCINQSIHQSMPSRLQNQRERLHHPRSFALSGRSLVEPLAKHPRRAHTTTITLHTHKPALAYHVCPRWLA
ncbi:hypothetical protein ACQKWADRAFT_89794 [Trichoderma austrokoningii]